METVTPAPKEAQRRIRGFTTTRAARWWMRLALLTGDAFFLAAALGISLWGRHILLGDVRDLRLYWRVVPAIGVFFLLAAWQGLYSSGNGPVRELRLLSESISITFLLLTAATFFTQTGVRFSRFIFLAAWLLALVLLPLSRWGLRFLAAYLGVWGEPLAVLGNGELGWRVAHSLNRQVYLGLRPLALLTASTVDVSRRPSPPVKVKRFDTPEKVLRYLKEQGLETIVIVPDELPDGWVSTILDTQHSHVRRAFFLSDLAGLCGVEVRSYDFDGMLGLELHQNLLGFWGHIVKRGMDLLLGGGGGLLISPVGLLIALLIKLDSPGPVFYRQERIGRYGKPFFVWKFRTMFQNADVVLEQYLRSNPDLQAEWDATQKLKNDPRVTRVGRFLRKFSLDELPQLMNVLKGEMSIVGPRPIVKNEIEKYGRSFELYKRVPPGITGMWQVSGRNNTTYEERVRLDEYYVRNWSIWLDIYIMIRTAWVVLSGDGAY